MAQRPRINEFEDIPLDEARRLCRGPRMNPELYNALKQNIQSPDNTAILTASNPHSRPS
jgi:hypothetical protein